MKVFSFISLILFFLVLITPVQAELVTEHEFEKHKPLTNQLCISCHKQTQKKWQQSDHAKAMAIANKGSVLADFNNRKVEHHGQKALFFFENNQHQVTISYDDKKNTYPIKYTFGHFPLQQYLVEVETGRLQVLPFAWDSRIKALGGQRWYHNYSHEEIRPEDRLHWRQPLQNWNGMCADCHSDGLVRDYDSQKNQFNTQFDNINVGCLSCHGDMSAHKQKLTKQDLEGVGAVNGNGRGNITSTGDVELTKTKSIPLSGHWLRANGEKTAKWQGEKRDNTFMDNCFACHSLRSPLTDGIRSGTPFLDQFTPQLPLTPNYYVDGQIKEEVYVYGSFLQSKMFSEGVNCLDCHDAHTMKLKIQGNGLCLQCHGAEVYNVKQHHQHDQLSTGAQCVNCHMPEKRYMGVDDRRDHSFKIPRPDLSIEFNSPNACTTCHKDESNLWASDKLKSWHGIPEAVSLSKQFLMKLNSGQSLTIEQHLSIIADETLDVISRAVALQLLSYTTETLNAEVLTPFLAHDEALLRLSSTIAANLLVPAEKVKYLSPLLVDQYRAIRVSAARNLLSSSIFAVDKAAFDSAFKALISSNEINSWRGEGRINQGVLAIEMNDFSEGERAFRKAIEIEPYFESGYVNLAEIYRIQNKPLQVDSILSKGIKSIPRSAALHYSYGLHFVREKEINRAIDLFSQSMILMPDNPQYAYTYLLALDGVGETKQALTRLKVLVHTYQNQSQLIELGLYFSQKLKSREDYDWFMKL